MGELAGIKTAPIEYAAAAEGLQVGRNWGTPVSHDYVAPFEFTGRINKVTVNLTRFLK